MTSQGSARTALAGASRLSKSFHRYNLAASGVLAATCVAGHAEAAVVYTDIADLTANPGELLFFNLTTGEAEVGTPTPVPTAEGDPNWYTSVTPDFSAWRIGNYFNGYDEVFINEFPENRAKKKATKKKARTSVVSSDTDGSPPGTSVAAMSLGEPINSNQFPEVDNHLDSSDAGDWQGGGTGYLGLRMVDPASGADLFGWARVTYDDVNNTMELHDFAYDDSGQPIAAGELPPPAVPMTGAAGMTLTLLSMGAVGLRQLRSARRDKAGSTIEG